MKDAPTQYAPGAPRVSQFTMGREANIALLIDNFHPSPQALIQAASNGDSFIQGKNDFYPGKRKPLDNNYRQFLQAAVEPHLRQTYNITHKAQCTLSLCAYSLTTTPTRKLKPIQQIPHIDTHEAMKFAVVHYICNERFGGTSFYRHRSSGFESITDKRLSAYFSQLKSEVAKQNDKPPAYIRESCALFEKINDVALVFNRALIYPSNLLHSGNIDPLLGLSSDPQHGRLTINSFISMS